MQDGKASQTAVPPAYLRAAHQKIDASPRILEDPIAVRLVEGIDDESTRMAAATLQTPISRLLRSIFTFRSRFAEDQLAVAVRSGLNQYVVLGAGLDTFAYRQPPWARSLRIIEVDHPESQRFKRERLSATGVAVPGNVQFCPIDFERMTLGEGLRASSFDRDAAVFFSWLGVTQYLSIPAIVGTLEFVASGAKQSAIALTFVLPDEVLSGEDLVVAQLSAAAGSARGEPWLTRLLAEEAVNLVRIAGFSDVFHLTPAEADERYFTDRTDGLHAPVIEQLLFARV